MRNKSDNNNNKNNPQGNMMNNAKRPASELMDSGMSKNSLRGHSHGGGSNNGGKDGNMQFTNSALIQRRDNDGDVQGGRKGKKR